MVEAWFDTIPSRRLMVMIILIMEDMNALYFSENFAEKVAPDHANFMDLTGYGRIVSQEDVFLE